jgi:hypothetical protein
MHKAQVPKLYVISAWNARDGVSRLAAPNLRQLAPTRKEAEAICTILCKRYQRVECVQVLTTKPIFSLIEGEVL